MKREPADIVLVARGFAESRTKAQALIYAGEVVVGEARVDKPGTLIDPDAPIRLKGGAGLRKYVSRGAQKLLGALLAFPIDPRGKVCADLGASTGGFTDLLLERGAVRVYAVDVGYGQLHEKLRVDSRVVVRERENARYLTAKSLGERVELVVADLSFISLKLVLPAIRELLLGGGHAVLLVKPQFEVGRGEVGKGGVVRDDGKRRAALSAVEDAARGMGFVVLGHVESPIEGPSGNREWLLALQRPEGGSTGLP